MKMSVERCRVARRKPIWNVLEGQFDITLVNAQHFKSVPGRKTDLKDGEWIGDLLQHGLLRKASYRRRPFGNPGT
jgi:hypothetical protein